MVFESGTHGESVGRDMNLKKLINLSAFFYSFDFPLLHSNWGEGEDTSKILDQMIIYNLFW